MSEKRDCMIIPVSNLELYAGNLIELCRSLTKGQRDTALQGMTLFLTWQSAELNSRPLTSRQSTLKEGCMHRKAAGLFKGKVVGSHHRILLGLTPQS